MKDVLVYDIEADFLDRIHERYGITPAEVLEHLLADVDTEELLKEMKDLYW